MNFIGAGITDIGISKMTNQDSISIKIAKADTKGNIAMGIICDGMGGLDKGEVASATVIKRFEKWFKEELPKKILIKTLEEIGQEWSMILKELNYRIMQYGKQQNISLGTTFSGVLIIEEQYVIVHVGDSRIYQITEKLEQLTEDQTFIQREIKRGNMTLEQAKVDSRKNLLLQCVGASREVTPEIKTGDVNKNTVFMLCSDGFRHVLTEAEIYHNLSPNTLTDKSIMEYNSRQLIDLVKSRNEKDNITVGLIKCVG